MFFGPSTRANPGGASVVSGIANFNGLGTSNLTINQSSNVAIINWQNFSIGAGEITRFVQPGVDSLAVNRVVTGNPSAIYGQLKANGGVMVINPNGILVGAGGVIDVGGALTLSTLDATNQDLLDGGSDRFTGSGSAGVVNYGAVSGRDVIFLGNHVDNYGNITAARSIALGAGGDILVSKTLDGATISVRGAGSGAETGISNVGSISGGNVQIEADGNFYALAINNSGVVRARGYGFKGGRLTLNAGSGGSVINTGNLYARNENGSGGQINVSAQSANFQAGKVDVSGEQGRDGGSVTVNASEIVVGKDALFVADGLNGGSVNLDAGGKVEMAGSISSRGTQGGGGSVDIAGGMVELAATAKVDVSGYEGGQIRVGGGFQGNEIDIRNSSQTTVSEGALIVADGELGDGGRVILWSDGDTMFGGDISAQSKGFIGNGGFVEVSGKNWLTYLGFANTSAANGITGTLLLDPTDVVIGPTGAVTMTDAALVAAVLTSNVVIHTSSGGTGRGDITVNAGSDIQYDSPNSLAFFANRHIFINGDIKNHGSTDTAFAGTGHITLVAGWDSTGASSFAASQGGVGTSVNSSKVLSGMYGNYGINGGSIFLNDAALEPVEVGSARGETNAFGSLFFLTSGDNGGEFTQFGYRRENDLRGRALAGLGADGKIGGGDDVYIKTFSVDADTGDLGDIDYKTGVTGNINVYAKDGVYLVPHAIDTNLTDRAYVMIGHGGRRENDDDMDNRDSSGLQLNDSIGLRDFGSDSGNTTLGNGNNSGNIVVQTGGVLVMLSGRTESHSQIGHGGGAHDDPDADRGNTASETGLGDNNDFGVSVFGDMRGDISVTASAISMTAGKNNDAFTMIGHGGERIRGDHSGNITVTTTTGGIVASASPDDNTIGSNSNRDRSFVQIGHGGYRSFHYEALSTAVDPGVNAGDQATRLLGIAMNSDTGLAHGHGGNITVNSARGIAFTASGNQAYAMIGHGGVEQYGDHWGDIDVNAFAGSIIFDRITSQVDGNGGTDLVLNRGTGAHVQIGHGGGARSGGGATGDINVSATGNIEMYAGRSESYAQLGHGGFSQDLQATETRLSTNGSQLDFDSGVIYSTGYTNFYRQNTSNGTKSGDITVNSGGDVIFRSGYGTGGNAYSQLGHGGRYAYAEAVGNTIVIEDPNNPGGFINGIATNLDTGHHGDISVNATGNLSFLAGPDSLQRGQVSVAQGGLGIEENRNDNYTMIGHGGRNSYGDHWGDITLKAGGNLELEARAGYDAVSIENNNGDNNTNTLGTPRLNQSEDNGATGIRNFAQIGHGGYDSDTDINRTGKVAQGMGVLGSSDIVANIGGNISVLGAMKETAGPQMIRRLGVETDVTSTPGKVVLKPVRLARADGTFWELPAPLFYSYESYAQIGHGGRSVDVDASAADGEGIRGNITLNAGLNAGSMDGNIRVEAGDIKYGISVGEQLEIKVWDMAVGGTQIGSVFVGPAAGVALGVSQDDPSQSLRNYAMIGHGGWTSRGDHSGNIIINGDGNLTVYGGMGRETFGMIGHGGFDSDRNNDDNSRLDDTGMSGSIIIDMGSGGIRVVGGGLSGDVAGSFGTDSAAGRSFDSSTRSRFALIGHGGAYTGGNHVADLIQVHGDGDIVVAGGTGENSSHAQIGNNGGANETGGRSQTLSGDISVVSRLGNITVQGGVPVVDNLTVTVNALGELLSAFDNTGHVSKARSSFGQIGHGGFDSDAQGGNQNNSAGNGGYFGDIEVIAAKGSVTLQGGGSTVINADTDDFRANYAKIGNGGGFSDGDASGEIRVVAGTDLTLLGGVASRLASAQIGHGGNDTSGNYSGTIDIEVGNNLVMQRGARVINGINIHDAAAKIGHATSNFQYGSNGSGSREGDILVSVGNSMMMLNGINSDLTDSGFGAQIGHVDLSHTSNGVTIGADGDTLIAVSRNNPTTGTGIFQMSSGSVITSADGGLTTELRLYMPSALQDQIASEAYLNSAGYNPSAFGGVGNRNGIDEHFGTEHTMKTGIYGEPVGDFGTPPEGFFPFHALGFYNIYFANPDDVNPQVPPTRPGSPVVRPPFELPAPLAQAIANQKNKSNYVAFDWSYGLFDYDGYEGHWGNLSPSEAVIGTYVPRSSLEAVLDSAMGSRKGGLTVAENSTVEEKRDDRAVRPSTDAEKEDMEEEDRLLTRALRKVGKAGNVFYLYEPGTNVYSSLRVYGAPVSDVPAFMKRV